MATRYWDGGGAANDFSSANNWSDDTAPSSWSNDDVIWIENTSENITAGLDQSAVTATGLVLNIADTYTGELGSVDAEGIVAYLQLPWAEVNIHVRSAGTTVGQGSALIALDCDDAATEINIHGSASTASDTSLPPILIKDTASGAVINHLAGRVGVAASNASEASNVSTINVGRENGGDSGAVMIIGDGATLATINQQSGTLTNRGANVTTITMDGGVYRPFGSATHTTVRINDGTCYYNSDGMLTTAHVVGTLDMTEDSRDVTITTFNLYDSGTFEGERAGTVTVTNNIDVKYPATLADVTVNGRGYTIDVEAS